MHPEAAMEVLRPLVYMAGSISPLDLTVRIFQECN